MEKAIERTEKKKMNIGEIRKMSSCCPGSSPISGSKCCPEKKTPAFNIPKVSTVWTWKEQVNRIRCRVSSFRNNYKITPGLYAVGEPDRDADVFVSANYKLSFDVLRRALAGMNAYILVLDTKGINVWCAAGKGTFGTEELVKRISDTDLSGIVSHRRIIVPQLGAPGVSAHEVKEKTGFRVAYGPVRANDIPDYIRNGYTSTKEMRTVEFSALDRLVLTPMELIPALKQFPWYALIVLLIFGIQPSGIMFNDAWRQGWPLLLLGVSAIMAGGFVTPLFLPVIPFRSFAVKGWITGFLMTFLAMKIIMTAKDMNTTLFFFVYCFFPMIGSFIALQFTGSTTFTNMAGVKKELRYALPVYIVSAAISALLLIAFVLGRWGLL